MLKAQLQYGPAGAGGIQIVTSETQREHAAAVGPRKDPKPGHACCKSMMCQRVW